MTLDDNALKEQLNNEENTKLKYVTPIIMERWGGEVDKICMEYSYTAGRITVDEYNIPHRGKEKRVDYFLLWKNNIPIALVEAKGKLHSADEGYRQAVDYAKDLDVPFAYATNGDDLIERDLISGLNRTMKMSNFPYPNDLWSRYKREKNISNDVEASYTYPYYITATGKTPRYYQRILINRTVEAVARGKKRILCVSATGTGKTFCCFQIIYRLWKAGKVKKILYLADRNILVDQTIKGDFKPFMEAMVKIDNKNINTSRDIYLGLYQQLKSGDTDYFRQFPRDFFDLILVDECHRGSARQDSNWHEILTYFNSATQIGLTATPKDGGIEDVIKEITEYKSKLEAARLANDAEDIQRFTNRLSRLFDKKEKLEKECNATYFGNPIFTYSLKQGIDDGFLAPYKVVSVELNIDKYGYRPKVGDKDAITGEPLDTETVYYQEDFDRKIIIPARRKQVAKRLTDFMKTNDMRYAKTILFCEDIKHCEEMVRMLENENSDIVKEHPNYIAQITGDTGDIGKDALDSFIDPYQKFPVIAVTSRLMSTGVDATTCEIVALDRTIGSMTEFKQIIGRGTRLKPSYELDGEEKSKMYFTILDFRKNYLKFSDPEFDGDPVTVTTVPEENPFPKPPVKPGPTQPPKYGPEHKKVARVNGVTVEIVGEDVQYLDVNGNLVTQNLTSCVKNNILGQYETFDDFKQAWLLAKDKSRFASELLLDMEWEKQFKIQYGYNVDNFDIISYLGYDIDPPMSKNQRTHNRALALYLEGFNDETQEILRLLLDSYSNTCFENLKDIKNIFSQEQFASLGYTPIKVIKTVFKTQAKYYKILAELENKLYE